MPAVMRQLRFPLSINNEADSLELHEGRFAQSYSPSTNLLRLTRIFISNSFFKSIAFSYYKYRFQEA